MIRVLVLVLPLLLALYALIDCIQTDTSEVRGLPKIGWIVLIVLVGVIGPLAWLVAGRPRGGRTPLPGWATRRGAPGAPARPLAPDDDPEFLGRLGSAGRDARLDEWEREMRSGPTSRSSSGPDATPDDDERGGDEPDEGPPGHQPAR